MYRRTCGCECKMKEEQGYLIIEEKHIREILFKIKEFDKEICEERLKANKHKVAANVLENEKILFLEYIFKLDKRFKPACNCGAVDRNKFLERAKILKILLKNALKLIKLEKEKKRVKENSKR